MFKFTSVEQVAQFITEEQSPSKSDIMNAIEDLLDDVEDTAYRTGYTDALNAVDRGEE